ncbi:hypothetical protein GCM10022631_01660 [Deinococcus rubellus]|uniref:Uncharacterized protein n=1 Tax=Deinococcus rubellus TaxID=1889240 RepID=A0ABY5YK77_9DEIO|nr:hypothetical protein [Deinococcus rubellus]UWX64747.1 hypothetical protein N0D28_03550 [Deinococcus rubellus]
MSEFYQLLIAPGTRVALPRSCRPTSHLRAPPQPQLERAYGYPDVLDLSPDGYGEPQVLEYSYSVIMPDETALASLLSQHQRWAAAALAIERWVTPTVMRRSDGVRGGWIEDKPIDGGTSRVATVTLKLKPLQVPNPTSLAPRF